MISTDKMQILVVEDDDSYRTVLAGQLAAEDREIFDVAGVEAGIAFIKEHHVDLVVTDMRLGARHRGGQEILVASKADDPTRPVVVVTAFGTIGDAVDATRLGALDYVVKPHEITQLRSTIDKALRMRARGNLHATPDVAPTADDVRLGVRSRSPRMAEVYRTIEKVAPSSVPVLITGETGTGKELVAHALHERSRRAANAFLAINCGAVQRELLPAELFGYERGAFTGALQTKQGAFEVASGGTLFLDEIGELPRDMQAALLRALQEGEIRRVGATKILKVDVRVIAATNRDLKQEIAAGSFREDLYHRLCVINIALPALRDRPEDIPPLVDHFIAKSNAREGTRILGIEPDALARLVQYAWPGNIRELENVIQRAVILSDGPRIGLQDLRPDIAGPGDVTPTPAPAGVTPPPGAAANARPTRPPDSDVTPAGVTDMGLKEQTKALNDRFQRKLILRALEQCKGNITRAAKMLKLSRKGLQLKMKELGLREPEQPPAAPGDDAPDSGPDSAPDSGDDDG